MNYISGLFNGSTLDSDIVIPESKSAIDPPPVFFMERNTPSSFEMKQMEDGNAPPRSENKNYEKPTRAEKQRDGVRFGPNMRKFFDNTQPVTSISQRVKMRNAESPTQTQPIGRQLNRSRSLSDSLSELSDMSSPESIPAGNASKNSSSFRSISAVPGEDMLRRSPSPVTSSPQTLKEYNDQITKDAHEKELALALMKRPSSPATTDWYGGKRRATRRATRHTKRHTTRHTKRNRKRHTTRHTKRHTKRNRKRHTKRTRRVKR